MKRALQSLLAMALTAAAMGSYAAVVQIDGTSTIIAGAAPITFSEVQLDSAGVIVGGGGLGTTNPVYQAIGPGSAGFSTGSFFVGQTFPQLLSSCPGPGGTAGTTTSCVLGSPTLPPSPAPQELTLATGGTTRTITETAFGAFSPVLSGSAVFGENPIAMLFAEDVSAVSFLAGGFNNIGNTRVQLYSRTGEVLFTTFNPGVCPPTSTGDPGVCPPDPIIPNFFTFAFSSLDASGNAFNSIAGILISVIGIEEEGFAIDNVRTVVSSTTGSTSGSTSGSTGGSTGGSTSGSTGGSTGGSTSGQVPEPSSLALVGLALLGFGIAWRRRLV